MRVRRLPCERKCRGSHGARPTDQGLAQQLAHEPQIQRQSRENSMVSLRRLRIVGQSPITIAVIQSRASQSTLSTMGLVRAQRGRTWLVPRFVTGSSEGTAMGGQTRRIVQARRQRIQENRLRCRPLYLIRGLCAARDLAIESERWGLLGTGGPWKGTSSHGRPSSSRPAFFLFVPPHCLKKKGTRAFRH